MNSDDKFDFEASDIDLENLEIPDIDSGEINEILDKGVVKRESFYTFLKRCIGELGVNNIFHDRKELIVIAIIGIIILSLSIRIIGVGNINSAYSFIFIASPVIYLSMSIFSFYNSLEKGAFELEMTCKYDLYQLSAIRMFIFSIASIILNTGIIIVYWLLNREIDFLRLLIISVTGLLIFSVIFLYSIINLKGRFIKFAVIGIWFVGNILLSMVRSNIYIEILKNIPIYIHVGVCVICIGLYIKKLKNLVVNRKKGRG